MAQDAEQSKDQLNAEIKAWGKMVRTKSRRNLQSMTDKRTKKTQLKTKYRRFRGEIEGVAFEIPRHFVFLHKGVGRGWPIGRAGPGSARTPKPFLNPVIDDNIKNLADRVEKHRADIAVKNIRIS